MTAYDASQWGDFGVALVGAAAALAGLLFVALSINLHEIIATKGLTGRAAEGIATLVVTLIACSLLVVPGQDGGVLGVEWLVLGVAYGGLLVRLEHEPLASYPHQRVLFVTRVASHQALTVLLLLAGATTATRGPGGIYWLAVASLASIAVAMFDAWVLLVEIKR
jgi:hypothetical protein